MMRAQKAQQVSFGRANCGLSSDIEMVEMFPVFAVSVVINLSEKHDPLAINGK